MAIKEFWVGSVGPLLYDDRETYPDSVDRIAFRGAQIYLEEAPTEDEHVLRKVDTPSFSSDTAEQGDIWYFDGTIWALLHHGTAGQVLTTGGHAANPSWEDAVQPSDSVESETTWGISAAAGSSDDYSRADHTHGTPAEPTSSGDWTTDTDTWVYVSATSFKIEGKDVTSRFPVGCKIQITQTTDKRFYVVSAAFSTDTIVTVTGGSDYTIADATITSPKYSYASSPTGFPHWFNYTPSWTGFSSAPSGGTAFFRVEGRMVYVNLVPYTAGKSNANTCKASLPITAVTLANYYSIGHCWSYVGTTFYAGTWYVASGATDVVFRKTVNDADNAWPTSGNKMVEGWIEYRI